MTSIQDTVADITGFEEETASAVVNALACNGYIIVKRETVATALARGDMFRTPAAAGARAVLREAAGLT